MTTPDNQITILKERLSRSSLQFNAVVSADNIEKFEKDHQIVLPVDYKLFIQHIGNGGDGPPAYGIKPLGINESWWFDTQRSAWLVFENIKNPFPFSEQWIWEEDGVENEALQEKIFDGNIYLGTDGCGMDWTLIVSGQQQGFVWQISDVGISPCKPAMTFLQWYNNWSDHDKSSQNPFWWTD